MGEYKLPKLAVWTTLYTLKMSFKNLNNKEVDIV